MKTRRSFLILMIACSVGCTSPAPELRGQVAQKLVLHNISLISRFDRPVLDGSYMVIERGKIYATGTGDYRPDPGDLVIDGEGAFVSPGLIDMHVHVFDPSDLLLLLAHGVTT